MTSLNFSRQTKNLSQEITEFLTEENINIIGKEIGFIQRDSQKLDGFKFLDMLLFTLFNHKELSLSSMALQVQERYGITISKQAIDFRFSNLSVNFFKVLLEKALSMNIDKTKCNYFSEFERVRIKDSTAFKLPENMKEKYPNDNANTTAQIRIQFEYDIKNKEILDISLHPFRVQDAIDAQNTLSEIKRDELIIRDLGYIKLDVLKNIEKQNAFYLNRLRFGTNVFEKRNGVYKEVSLSKITEKMRCNNIQRIYKEVYIGAKDKFKTKLLLELLPEEEYQKRILKAKRNKSKKGYTLTNEFKTQLRLNVFITNTEIPADKIRFLYTLRWQIELMFKIWKTVGEINKVKKMKVERFETYLFAKLLWIALNWQIMTGITAFFFKEKGICISPNKLYKTLKYRMLEFRKAVISGLEKMTEFIDEMFRISPYYHLSEKKRKSVTWSYDVIEMFANKRIKA